MEERSVLIYMIAFYPEKCYSKMENSEIPYML